MGKNHRHQKNLKSEKAKVKLKTKKSKVLPKGQNVTDTSFKTKKIIIKEQLKSYENCEIVSRRKLNVKDLLTRLQHHNSTVRQEAIKELKEILQTHPPDLVSSSLSSLLQGICSLALDRERDIRRDTLRVLSLLLSPISTEQLAPFSEILISYLRCAMTHINPAIKEDSLGFLDVLVQSCPSLISRNSHRIMPNFLDMISRQQTSGRQLVTTLSSKSTSIKWRIKVLQRMSSIFSSIVSDLRLGQKSVIATRKMLVEDDTKSLGLLWGADLDVCRLDIDESDAQGFIDSFKEQVKVIIPLMIESWIEVRPKDVDEEDGLLLSQEAAAMLAIVGSILGNFVDVLEAVGREGDVGAWIREEFQEGFGKFFLEGFPYSVVKVVEKGRKRQGDFGDDGTSVNLLKENLGVSLGFLWMAGTGKELEADEKLKINRILTFVCERLRNWSNNDVPSLPILVKFLRILLLKSSKILYKNGISLGNTLRSTISAACRQPKRALQTQLFVVLGEIVLDHCLNELHSEPAFRNFVKTLPELLLHENIHENTIHMLNRAVLQHGNWIRTELAKKQEEIIENAKKINIIGSPDEKESRLMICNLLHFLDGQIYF